MQTRSFDETWEQPWGERRYVRNRYNEMSVRLTEKNPPGRSLVVVFRVFDEGVGFRYEFPDQPQLRDVNIGDELTEFTIAEPGTAWWIPGGEWNRYEYLYRRTALDEVAQAHTPLTIRTDAGLHIAIHEAALVDYSAMWLRRVDGTRLKAVLSPAAQGAKVKRVAPFSTPWRTLLIADNAGALYMASDIILNLNEPNRLGDVSWFKPAKYVGIWWGMHIDEWSWASGPKHGATTANTRRYIDFAAQHGFRGVLVEGWNVGWDGDWFANGETFSFTQPYPDFDLQGLAEYAKRKGVRLVGHHETSANIAHYEAAARSGARSLPAARHRQREDRLRRRRRRREGARRRRQDSLRVARRSGHVAPSSQGGHGGGEASHRGGRARADQGHGLAAHVSELGLARRRARHGVQRVGRSAEPAGARSESRVHAHALGSRSTSRRAC